MHPLLLGAASVCVFLFAAPQEDGPLVRAGKLLQDTKEQSCKDGTELCVREDSVAAVELLLDVLGLETDRGGFLPSAHYRDVVWDGLRRMESSAARLRVQQELVKNKKNARVRQWCAELLGEYGHPLFVESLGEALSDKELEVRRAAARALGRLRFAALEGGQEPLDAASRARVEAGRADALAGLNRLRKDKDAILRANALESLTRLQPLESKTLFLEGLKDKDAGVRCALLGAVPALYPDEVEALAASALADVDWRPRMQAVDLLARERSASATGRLVTALGDGRPAVVARAVRHLQALTGLQHTRKEAWEAWWKQAGADFEAGKPAAPRARAADGTVATFNGIELHSDHVAFLIDASAHMAAALESQKCSKQEASLRELEAALTRLQGKLTFSLFTYAVEPKPLHERGALELTPKNQARALAFVGDERLLGAKDIWQALEAALADPDIDTVFLLSSGEPDIGLYVHWNRVTWHLAELNRFRKVVVHAIAYSDEQWYREQLQKIAEVTGGEFTYFE